MRSSFWQRLVSFPAMLVSILFVSPFFASLDVQQGGPVMRDPDIWWHLRNAQSLLATWIAVLLAAINIGPRTILFGWLCFLAEILILEAFRQGRDRLWLLVPLFALWINLHGSWLIGYAFLMLYLASGLVEGSWGSI